MKAKKLLSVLALALAATTLTACGDKSVTFGQYWFTNSVTKEEAFYEKAEYTVSSKSYNSSYCNYTVDYSGSFTTTLEYLAKENTYSFATELAVKTTFKLGNETQTYDDYMQSTVTFKAPEASLRPVKSTKKMNCHVPLSGNFEKVENCFAVVDYDYTINYAAEKNEGTIKSDKYDMISNDGKKSSSVLEDTFEFIKNYTYIDNEQLLVALRAFAADSTGGTLSSYSAFAENTQKVKITFSDTEDKGTESFNYTLVYADGTENTTPKNILCRTAKINLDQKNPGVTHTVKLAKSKNTSQNDYRNLILTITTPLSYSMGEIYYKLNKVSYQKP